MKKGWKVESLGEICQIEMGKTPPRGSKKYWDTEKVTDNVWLSIADLNNTEDKQVYDSKEYISNEGAKLCKIVKKGTLLASFKLTLGRLAFAGRNLYTNEAIAALSINDEKKLSKDFLFWYLTYFDWDSATGGDIKVKGKTLNKEKLKAIPVPIPLLPEQQRIVTLLDETLAALTKVHANAERNQVNAREVFESVLENCITGKESRKWEVKTVGKVSEHSLGKMLDKQKNRGKYKKYLRNLNVRWFGFDLTDVNEMRFLEEEKEKYTAIKGDLLICEGGYPGRAAIWEEDYPIYFQKAIHRVRFEKNVIPKWFLYCLYSADLSGRLKKYLTGTGIQHFTGQAVDRFEFPVPPLAEQRAIVQRLDALAKETHRLEEVYQSKVEAVEELRRSVLGKAFAGEL